MFEQITLRDEAAPPGLVVVRLGARTMDNDLLKRSVDECHDRWGIWGFSVLEVPNGDYERLARIRPIVADRRQFLIADAAELIEDGFPLLPTLDTPHWTVLLAEANAAQFERVRAHFRGPLDNPRTGMDGEECPMLMETTDYDRWYDATSVGADLVVETWISHGPSASDATFDPRPGDWLLVGDDEGPPCRARVIRRDGNRVWTQLDLGLLGSIS